MLTRLLAESFGGSSKTHLGGLGRLHEVLGTGFPQFEVPLVTVRVLYYRGRVPFKGFSF